MSIYDEHYGSNLPLQFVSKLAYQEKIIQEELVKLPNAKLTVIRNGSYTQWHISSSDADVIRLIKRNNWSIINGERGNAATTNVVNAAAMIKINSAAYAEDEASNKTVIAYLPKTNSELANSLLRRDILQEEKTALAEYRLRIEKTIERGRRQSQGKAIKNKQRLLNDEQHRMKTFYENWMNTSYVKNNMPYLQRHHTKAGFDARSKSEAHIADALYDKEIPFLYEPYLLANGKEHYPDFVIVHPITGKVYIWEHNGSMDDSTYLYRVQKRIRDYSLEGFLLGDDLIFTSESSTRALDYQIVDDIINRIIIDNGDVCNEKWSFEKWDGLIHDPRIIAQFRSR